jgi:hypothetical protein
MSKVTLIFEHYKDNEYKVHKNGDIKENTKYKIDSSPLTQDIEGNFNIDTINVKIPYLIYNDKYPENNEAYNSNNIIKLSLIDKKTNKYSLHDEGNYLLPQKFLNIDKIIIIPGSCKLVIKKLTIIINPDDIYKKSFCSIL